MMLLRNILFYSGVFPAAIIISLLALLLHPFPFHWRYWFITRWSHFYIFWVKHTCGLKYKVDGLRHLPKENAVVISNHQSSWETVFFQVLLPMQSWVLKKELLFIPGFGWGLAQLQPIAIERKELNSIRALLKQGKERLKSGRWVIIFPEGTRVPYGQLQRFTRTGASLAHATQKPIVPIAHNAGKFWPKGFLIRKPVTIHVSIGPVIYPEGKTATELNALSEEWIRNKLKEF